MLSNPAGVPGYANPMTRLNIPNAGNQHASLTVGHAPPSNYSTSAAQQLSDLGSMTRDGKQAASYIDSAGNWVSKQAASYVNSAGNWVSNQFKARGGLVGRGHYDNGGIAVGEFAPAPQQGASRLHELLDAVHTAGTLGSAAESGMFGDAATAAGKDAQGNAVAAQPATHGLLGEGGNYDWKDSLTNQGLNYLGTGSSGADAGPGSTNGSPPLRTGGVAGRGHFDDGGGAGYMSGVDDAHGDKNSRSLTTAPAAPSPQPSFVSQIMSAMPNPSSGSGGGGGAAPAPAAAAPAASGAASGAAGAAPAASGAASGAAGAGDAAVGAADAAGTAAAGTAAAGTAAAGSSAATGAASGIGEAMSALAAMRANTGGRVPRQRGGLAPRNGYADGGQPSDDDAMHQAMFLTESGTPNGQQVDSNGKLVQNGTSYGAGQIQPETAKNFAKWAGLAYDPNKLVDENGGYNRTLATAGMDHYKQEFGDPVLAYGAYNGGESKMQDAIAQAKNAGVSAENFMGPNTQRAMNQFSKHYYGDAGAQQPSVGLGAAAAPQSAPAPQDAQAAPTQNAPTQTGMSPTAGINIPGYDAGANDGKGTWFSRNQDWVVPTLAGLGGMASSNSRFLGSALLQGLGTGASAYAGLQNQLLAQGKEAQGIKQMPSELGVQQAGAQAQLAQAQAQLAGVPSEIAQRQAATQAQAFEQWQALRATNPADAGNDFQTFLQKYYPSLAEIAGVTPAANTTAAPVANEAAAPQAIVAPVKRYVDQAKFTNDVSQLPTQTLPADTHTLWNRVSGKLSGFMPGSYNPTNDADVTTYNNARQNIVAAAREANNAAPGDSDSLAQIKRLQTDAAGVQTGPTASWRMAGKALLNDVWGALGGTQETQPDVGAAGDLGSLGTSLTAQFTRQFGTREGAQVINMVHSAVPNTTTAPQALARIAAMTAAFKQRDLDRAQFLTSMANDKTYAPADWQSVFDQTHPANTYVQRAVVNSIPATEVSGFRDQVNGLDSSKPENVAKIRALGKAFNNKWGPGAAQATSALVDSHD